MKLLLVLGSDEAHRHISQHVKPLGFDLIRYNHVLKAMDNIGEIDPSAIIISARDFPRHWKTMVQFVRSEKSKESCPIIILKGDNFTSEEASKASFLGVSGVIPEFLDNPKEISRLHGILNRYLNINNKRRNERLFTESWQRFGFIFTRPDDNVFVSGEVKNISFGGMAFMPDKPSLIEKLLPGTEFNACSLRAGESILSPVCRLTRAGPIISLEFILFPDGESEILGNYIEEITLKETGMAQEQMEDSGAL